MHVRCDCEEVRCDVEYEVCMCGVHVRCVRYADWLEHMFVFI